MKTFDRRFFLALFAMLPGMSALRAAPQQEAKRKGELTEKLMRDPGELLSSEILNLEDVSGDPRIEIAARALCFGSPDYPAYAMTRQRYTNAVHFGWSTVMVPQWRHHIPEAMSVILALDSAEIEESIRCSRAEPSV